MKKLFALILLFAFTVPVFADGPIGYPGSAWAVITVPASTTGVEKNNLIFQGKIEQGIDWFYLDSESKWKLNTYVSFGYSADSEALGYNNKAVPAIGVKTTRTFTNGVFELGVQAIHEDRWIDNVSSNGVQAYASTWFGWNLKK